MAYTSGRFVAEYNVHFLDRSNERSLAPIYVPEDVLLVDAAGDGAPDDATLIAWNVALVSITDGAIEKYSLNQSLRNTPDSGAGRREQKYTFYYTDNITGKKNHFEVPCRDATIETPPNTDLYDLTVAPWVAVKTAFQNAAVSDVGNPVTLRYVELTGKNN